jgi:hypothetical protein
MLRKIGAVVFIAVLISSFPFLHSTYGQPVPLETLRRTELKYEISEATTIGKRDVTFEIVANEPFSGIEWTLDFGDAQSPETLMGDRKSIPHTYTISEQNRTSFLVVLEGSYFQELENQPDRITSIQIQREISFEPKTSNDVQIISCAWPCGDYYNTVWFALWQLLIIGLLLEVSMNTLYCSRMYLRHFYKKGVKTFVSLAFALGVAFNYEVDIFSKVVDASGDLQMQHYAFVGNLVSAVLIVGVSNMLYSLFCYLKLHDPEKVEKKALEEQNRTTAVPNSNTDQPASPEEGDETENLF